MKDNNIKDAYALSVKFREQQKSLWRSKISKSKKVIYWSNEDIDLPVQDEDVIQWWGVSANVDQLKGIDRFIKVARMKSSCPTMILPISIKGSGKGKGKLENLDIKIGG